MTSQNNNNGSDFKSTLIKLLMLFGMVAFIAGILIFAMNGGF